MGINIHKAAKRTTVPVSVLFSHHIIKGHYSSGKPDAGSSETSPEMHKH